MNKKLLKLKYLFILYKSKFLKKNGIMIFDDALQNDKSLQYKSYQGVKNFLDFFGKEIKILYFQNILVIKKII